MNKVIQEQYGWYIESNGAHQYSIDDLLDNFCPCDVKKEILDPKRWVDIEEWCREDDDVWKVEKNKVDQLGKLRDIWTDTPECMCKLYKIYYNELCQCDKLSQIATYFYTYKGEEELVQRYHHCLKHLIPTFCDLAKIDLGFARELCVEAKDNDYWGYGKDFEKELVSTEDTKKLVRLYAEEFEVVDYDTQREIDFATAQPQLIAILKSELELLPEKGARLMEKNIDDEYRNMLNETVQKCNSKDYKIALVGEYQSGKTTTINALCGGKQVGAIGKGLKTSAVPLSISYTETDSINIVWKSKSKIQEIISTINPAWFGRDSALYNYNFKNIDIDDELTRNIIQAELENIRKKVLKEPFEIEGKDKQNITLCSIALKYWNSEFLKKSMAGLVSISSISDYTRFPKDFVERWWDNSITDFKDEEVLFFFIEEIKCWCNSPLLQQMGGTVMDTLGLFASEYDSKVTEDAKLNSDAILYLLPRERGRGEQLDRELKEFKSTHNDYKRKIILVSNLSFKDINFETIYNHYQRLAKDYFGGEYGSLIGYDALLAYLAQIKMSYDKGLLDDNTINDFINNSRPPKHPIMQRHQNEPFTFDKAWNVRVQPYYYPESIPDCEKVYLDSKLGELITLLHRFINKNKSYSVIIDSGVNKLRKNLISARSHLYTLYIEPYLDHRDKLIEKWSIRKENLEKFENEAAKQLEKKLQDDNTLVSELTDEVYNKLFTEEIYEDMVDDLCQKLYDNASDLYKCRKDEKKLSEKIGEIFATHILTVISKRFNHWNDLMETNQEVDFSILFSAKIFEIEKDLSEKWVEKYCLDEHFRQRREHFFTLPLAIKDARIIVNSMNINNVSTKYKLGLASKEGNLIFSLVAIAWAIGIGLITKGYGLISYFGAFLGGGSASGGALHSFTKKRFIKSAKPEVSKSINEDLKKAIHDIVYKEMERLINAYIRDCKINWEKFNEEKNQALKPQDSSRAKELCINAISSINHMRMSMDRYNAFVKRINQA